VSRLVVMGVSGAGKSTVAVELAARLGADFVEGDALHPVENVAKMRRGEPLDDADRVELGDRASAFPLFG
jgi:gluconokinase